MLGNLKYIDIPLSINKITINNKQN
jgi:hypothetical protein